MTQHDPSFSTGGWIPTWWEIKSDQQDTEGVTPVTDIPVIATDPPDYTLGYGWWTRTQYNTVPIVVLPDVGDAPHDILIYSTDTVWGYGFRSESPLKWAYSVDGGDETVDANYRYALTTGTALNSGQTVRMRIVDSLGDTSKVGNVYTVRVKDSPYTDDADYLRQFGFDALDIGADLTLVTAMRSTLSTYFDELFASRMINSETYEQWQLRLQRNCDREAPRFERALRLYAANASAIDQAAAKTTTTYTNLADTESGTDTVSSVDTPDAAVNASADYADNRRTTTYGHANTRTGSVSAEDLREGGLLRALNTNIDAWRPLAMEFVDTFAKCFLNVFNY